MTTSYPNVLLFIDGHWKPSATSENIDVFDPATGDVIGTVAKAGRSDLDEALVAARRGFESWRKTSAFDRAALMRRAANNLRASVDATARLMTMEQGKPLQQSRIEVLAGADIIDWFAGEAPRAYGQTIPSRLPNVVQMTIKMPVGPVAAFTPWNFPINQAVRKVAAALAAGCSIVLKAPEETPASASMLVRAFEAAGLPAGVLSLIFGDPAEISGYLIPHPVIRKVSFTGSTQVGKHLASLAGLHMKRITMELGGHAPVIVAEDADVASAVRTMAAAKFRNAGQICVAPTRFLVHESIAQEFTSAFASEARNLKVGNGKDPETQMGPLANDRRLSALDGLVQDAVSRNATLVTGGRRIGNVGNFFEPTVISDVPSDARIMNEEPFGPIAVINRFQHVEDAIVEANRLPVGLAAYGFTTSSATATRFGEEIAAGMVSINHYGLALPETPFGGIGDSGHGTEGGSEALDGYMETRFVTRIG